MQIKILGTESLGVRGLSCSITLKNRKIIIDPGIALGWQRHGYHPHPFQVAVGVHIRNKIISELSEATDIVISHFDGDHIPLANANPYQLSLYSVKSALTHKHIWAKGAVASSTLEKKRRQTLENTLGKVLPNAEMRRNGALSFSSPVPHGLRDEDTVSVMMTRIEEEGKTFVHASDIQFIHEDTVDQILALKPDIVLSSGPPLYLAILSKAQRQKAKQNALILAENVETLIIDHHLLRSEEGDQWLEDLAYISGQHVINAAEFMHREPLYLEAWREDLYQWLPIPENWHKTYQRGEADLSTFWQRGWQALINHGKISSPHCNDT
jgi:hypothetical protein